MKRILLAAIALLMLMSVATAAIGDEILLSGGITSNANLAQNVAYGPGGKAVWRDSSFMYHLTLRDSDNMRILYTKSTANHPASASDFPTPTAIITDGFNHGFWLDTTDDKLHLVYYDQIAPERLVYTTCTTNCHLSGSWTEVSTLYTGTIYGAPDIALHRYNGDANYRVHFVYVKSASQDVVRYRYWDSSTGLSSEKAIPLITGTYLYPNPSIDVDSTGRIHVGARQHHTSTTSLRRCVYTQSSNGGVTWQKIGGTNGYDTLASGTSNVQSCGILVTGNNKLQMAYTAVSNDNYYGYTGALTGSTWTTALHDSIYSNWGNIGGDAAGNVYYTYSGRSGTTGDIYYKRYDASTGFGSRVIVNTNGNSQFQGIEKHAPACSGGYVGMLYGYSLSPYNIYFRELPNAYNDPAACNDAPTLTGVSVSTDPIKGGAQQTVTPSGVADGDSDPLYLYCCLGVGASCTATSANSVCDSDGPWSSPYSSMACTYDTSAGSTQSEGAFCRLWDGTEYDAGGANDIYDVDSDAPITTDNAPAGWQGSNPTITLGATDAGAATVSWTKYCIDTANTCTPATTYSVAFAMDCGAGQACTKYVRYQSQDSVGNLESVKSTGAIQIDLEDPTTTDNAPAGWQSDNPSITLNPSDGSGSGITFTKYCIDTANTCTPGTTYSGPVATTCAAGGVCTQYIRYYSSDNVDNEESVKSTGAITIDRQAPTTTDNAPAGWQATNPTVTLTPSDGSGSGMVGGSADTDYCIDTADTCTPTTSGTSAATTCTAGDACTQYIRYRSTDAVGNVEGIKSTGAITIDMQAPTTTDNYATVCVGTSPVAVTLTPTDPNSGMGGSAWTKYCIDTAGSCTPTTSGTAPSVTCADDNFCNQYVRYHSQDAVGNTEAAHNSALVTIDRKDPSAGPTPVVTGTGATTLGVLASGGSDTGCGSSTLTYKYTCTQGTGCTNSGWLSDGSSHDETGLSAGAQYCYTVEVKDNVGNIGAAGSAGCGYTDAAVPTLTGVNAYGTSYLGSGLGDVTTTWTANGNEAGTLYEVRRDGSTTVMSETAGVFTYTNTGLADNTEYCYDVRARVPGGTWSGYSSSSCATTLDRTKPATPVFTVTENSGNIDLDWTYTETGLLGYWAFEDGSGITAEDWTTSPHDGTISGGSWASGNTDPYTGGAITLTDGGYVDFGADPTLKPVGAYTIATWFKTTTTANYPVLVSSTTSGTGHYQGYMLRLGSAASDGKPYGRLGNGVSGEDCNVAGTTLLNDGLWHHAALVFDGGMLYLYADGKLEGSTPCAKVPYYDGTPVTAGYPIWTGFSGEMDEIRVYDSPLSQEDIIETMETGLIKFGAQRADSVNEWYGPIGGVADKFSDNEYTSNPTWTVGAGSWTASGGYLRTTGTNSKIYIPSTQAYGYWEWDMKQLEKQEFWLMNQNTGMAMSGGVGYLVYFYNGNIILAKSTGSSSVELSSVANTNDGTWASFKVFRDSNGGFKVYKDDVLLFDVVDNTYTSSSYMGMFAWDVTSGNGGYDNIRTGQLIKDDTYTDTTAEDNAAPNTPAVPTVAPPGSGDRECSTTGACQLAVTWADPGDVGTDYYYTVKAYDDQGNEDNILNSWPGIISNSNDGTYSFWYDGTILSSGRAAIGDTLLIQYEAKITNTAHWVSCYIFETDWSGSCQDQIKTTDWSFGQCAYTISADAPEIRVECYHGPSGAHAGSTAEVKNLRLYKIKSDAVTAGMQNYDLTGAGVSNPYTGLTTTISTLNPNQYYTYAITARDNSDNLGSAGSAGNAYTLALKPSITTAVGSGTAGAYQCVITPNMNGNPVGTEYFVDATTSLGGETDSAWTASTAQATPTYTDTALTSAHGTYQYRIRARNGDSVQTTYTSIVNCVIPNNLPTTPTGSSLNGADQAGESLVATGAGSTDGDSDPITYYYRFNCGSAGGTQLQAKSVDNSWTIDNTCGKGNSVYVSIWANDGIVDSTGSEVESVAIVNTPPTTPTGSSLNTADQVGETLTATGAGSTDMDSGDSVTYRYEFRCDSAGGALLQAQSTDNTWDITTACGKTHTVYVLVWGHDGTAASTSYETETKAIVNTAPTTPTGTSVNSVTRLGEDLVVTGAGSTDVDNDAVTYRYEFRLNSATGTVLQAQGTDNSYVMASPAVPGNTIYMLIWGHDGTTASASYETETRTVQSNIPSTPTASASSGKPLNSARGKIAVAWGANGNQGGTEYEVQRNQSTTVYGPGTLLTYTNDDIDDGTQYCYRVRARISGGTWSDYTSEDCATTIDRTAPADPVLSTSIDAALYNVDLDWTATGTNYNLWRVSGTVQTEPTIIGNGVFDDFNSYGAGAPPAPWAIQAGNWEVQSVGGTNVLGFTTVAQPGTILYTNTPTVSDYSAEVEIYDNYAAGNNPHPGIIVSWQDAQNYDAIYLRVSSNEIVHWQYRSGGATTPIIGTTTMNANEWINAKAVKEGTSARVYINDKFIGSITVLNAPGVGLWYHTSNAAQNAYFDNFKVLPLYTGTHYDDTVAVDDQAPEKPSFAPAADSTSQITVTWTPPTENGATYWHMAGALDSENNYGNIFHDGGCEKSTNQCYLKLGNVVSNGYTIDNSVKYTGESSLRQDTAASTRYAGSDFIIGTDIEANTYYRAECMVKTALSAGYARIYPEHQFTLIDYSSTSGTTDWTRIHTVFKSGASGDVRLLRYTLGTATGQTWWDSCSLRKLTETDATSGLKNYDVTETTSNPGGTSGTDTASPYVDTGLSTNVQYCYTVAARDNADNLGSSYSAICKYTLAAAPTVTSVTCVAEPTRKCTVVVNANGNPGTTEYYIDAVSGTGASDRTWGTSTSYDDTSVAAHATSVCYKVMARNGDTTETALSAQVCDDVPNALPTDPTTLTPSTSGYYGGTSASVNIACSGSTDADTDTLYYDIESYYNAGWNVLSDNDADGNYAWDVGAITSQSGVDIRCRATDTTDNSGYKTNNNVIIIDNTNPITTDDAPAGWQASNPTVALTPSDSSSGMVGGSANTEYCIDTSDTCTPSTTGTSKATTCTAGNVCTEYIRYRSTDAVGNVEDIKTTGAITIDMQDPATTDNAPAGWQDSNPTVTLTPSDGSGSGIGTTYYCMDTANTCNPTTTYSAPVATDCTAGAVCTKYIRYYSTDNAGNSESIQSTGTIQIDTAPPSTTDNAPAGWQSGDISVSLTPTDGSGSGIASTEYCKSTTPCAPDTIYPGVISVTCASGNVCEEYICYKSTDNVGNVEDDTCTAAIQIDKQVPTTTDNAPAGWQATNPTVTLTPSDGSGSGIATTQYCIDATDTCTPSITGTSATTTCGAGVLCTQYIRYKSTDNVGNVETTKSTGAIQRDDEAPTTTDNAPSGWQGSDVTVTLTPSDGSGSDIANTYYCIDTADTCTPTTPGTSASVTCTAGQVCIQYVRYYSVDNMGNSETVQSTGAIQIDKEAPSTSDDAPAGWQNDDYTVALTPTDPGAPTTGSGIANTYYCIDTSNTCSPTTLGTAASVTCGTGQVCTQYVRYYSIDNAENIEEVQSTGAITIDKELPSTTDNAPAGWQDSNPTVTLTPSDGSGSGIGTTYYCMDTSNACNPTTTYSAPVATDCTAGSACTTYIRYYSTDNAGNNEATQSTGVIQIDLQAPTTTDNYATSCSGSSPISMTLSPTDGTGSGLVWTKYCIDTDGSCIPSTTGTTPSVTCADDNFCDRYVRYHSMDNVGNTEAEHNSQIVTIDLADPDPGPTPVVTASSTTTLSALASGGSDTGCGSSTLLYQYTCTQGTDCTAQSGWLSDGSSHDETGLTPGTEYCYTVEVQDSVGNIGAAGTDGCGYTTAAQPGTPTVAGNEAPLSSELGKVTVTWTNGGNSAGTEYEVQRDGATSLCSATTDLTCTDTGLADNTEYCYRVHARPPSGTYSSWTAETCVTTPDRTSPASPDLTAAEGSNAVDLSWNQPETLLELYMPFEEGTGTATDDWAPIGHTGLVQNAVWGTGNTDPNTGGALDFDLTPTGGDMVLLDNIMNGPVTTITAWVNTVGPGDWKAIYGACDDLNSACTGSDYKALIFRIDNLNKLKLYWSSDYSNTQIIYGETTETVPPGVWMHVAAVLDTTANTLTFYMDGEPKETTYLINTNPGAGSIDIVPGIGAFNSMFDGLVQEPYTGTLDEVRIYNSALTEHQIKEVMNSGTIRYGLQQSDTVDGEYAPVGGFGDTFSECTAGNDPTCSGWVYEDTEGSVFDIQSAYGHDTALHIVDPVPDYPADYVRRTFDGFARGIVEFDIYNEAKTAYGPKIHVAGPNGLFTWMVFYGDSKIRHYRPSTGWQIAGSYTEDKWENVKIYIDCNNNEFSLFLNGVKQPDVLPYTTCTTVNRIEMNPYGLGAATTYFDNFKVTPLISDDEYTDTSTSDTESPNTPNAPTLSAVTDTNITVSWDAVTDVGSDSFYYLNAFDTPGNENNLVENGGGERDITGDNNPDAWGNSGCAGVGDYVTQSTDAHMGDYSIRVNTGCSNNVDSNVNDYNTAGETIRIEAAIKGAGYVRLYCYDGSMRTVASTATGSAGSWGVYTATGTVPAECSDATKYYVYLYSNGNDVLFDNVRTDNIESATVTSGILSYTVTEAPDTGNSGTHASGIVMTGLDPNTQYCYNVSATDNQGNEGAASTQSCNYTLPADPNVTSSHTASTWSADNTLDFDLTNNANMSTAFYVWDQSAGTSASGGTSWSPIASTLQLTATPDGNSWHLHVIAENPDGDENAGGTKHFGPYFIDTAAPTPDPATFAGMFAFSTTKIYVNSTDGSDTNTPISYELDETTQGATFDQPVQPSPAFAVGGLTVNTQYCFKVQMTDAIGNAGAWTTTAFCKYTRPTVPVLASSSHTVSVTSSDNTVDVTASGTADEFFYVWDKIAGTSASSGTIWNGAQKTLTATSDGNWYLHAVSLNGDEDENIGGTQHLGPFVIDTAAPTPDPATITSVVVISGTQLTVTVDTGTDTATPVQYQLDETLGGTTYDQAWQTSNVFALSGLDPGVEHCFKAQLKDAVDNTGDWTTTAVCEYTLPNNPFITAATAQATDPLDSWLGSVAVTWDANGNAGGTVYGLERDGTSVYSGTEVTFTDTNIEDNKEYCYRVKATAGGGGESGWSRYICATTVDRTGPSPPDLTATEGTNDVGLSWAWAGDEIQPDALSTGLSGNWGFEQGGITAEDSSVNMYDGAVFGTWQYVPGIKESLALRFNGGDVYVDMGSALNMGTDDWTTSLWFSTIDNDGSLIAKSFYGPGSGRWFTVIEGDVIKSGFEGTGGLLLATTPATPYRDSNWHHLTTVYDRSGLMSLYLDGELMNTASISGSVGYDMQTAYHLFLGMYNDNIDGTLPYPSGLIYEGDMDDVRVYNRALTVDEVMALTQVGSWHFDEGTGTDAYDATGFGNDGTVTGATWIGGIFNTALNFDAVGEQVMVPYHISLAPEEGLTIEAWFKADNFVDNQRIVSKTEGGGYQLSINENSCPGEVCMLLSTGSYHIVGYAHSNLNIGQWHHIVGTYDGNTEKLYIDGVEVDSNSNPSGDIVYNADNPLCIGREATSNSCGGGNEFAGDIDDVRVWRRALTAAEIQARANYNVYSATTVDGTYSELTTGLTTNAYTDTDANDTAGPGAPGDPVLTPSATSMVVTWAGATDVGSDWYHYVTALDAEGNRDVYHTTSGLVSYWPLNEGDTGDATGGTAYDHAGSNDGTISGGTWTTGEYGGALDFTGGSGNKAALSTPITQTVWSIEFWAQQDAGAGIKGMVMGDTNDVLSFIWMYEGNYLRFRPDSGGDNDWTELTDFTTMSHYTLVSDGTDVTLYKNGAQVGTPRTPITTGFTINAIGQGYSNDGYSFGGVIDEVQVYDRTLTPEEIASVYHAGEVTHTTVTAGIGSYSVTEAPDASNSGTHTSGDTMSGLTENTQYCYTVTATDNQGNAGTNSTQMCAYTLPADPSVTSSHTTSTWSTDNTLDFDLANPTKMDRAFYKWDQLPTTSAVGGTEWTPLTSTLPLTATPDANNWHLHVIAENPDGTINFGNTIHFGPYWIDSTAPTPDPATLAGIFPFSTTKLYVNCTDGSDTNTPIGYELDETTQGTTFDQPVQPSPAFAIGGLTANTQYCFKTQMSDALGNTGAWTTTEVCSYTLAEDPSISSVTCSGTEGTGYKCDVSFSMGSNPSGTEHYITASSSDGGTGFTDYNWGTTASPYTDTGLDKHKTYCYNIKARNGDDVGTTPTVDTCTQIVNVAPTLPALSSPTNTQTLETTAVAFDWTDSTDANNDPITYAIQVATDTSFSNKVVDTTTSSSAYESSVFIDSQTYYWKVKATDAFTGDSGWTSYWTFDIDVNDAPTVPTLSLPTDGYEETATRTVAFDWTDSSDPESDPITYRLQVDDNTGFSTPDVGKTGLTSSGYTLTAGEALADGTWYWQVMAEDDRGGQSAWTSYNTLIVHVNTAPPTPTHTTPEHQSEVIILPTFDWSTEVDPDSDTVTYELQIDDNEDFLSAHLLKVTLSTSTYTLQVGEEFSDGTDYHWRVRSKDNSIWGHYSDWSTHWTVSATTNFAPSVPVLLTPENEGTVESTQPTFTWEEATDPESSPVYYDMQIAEDDQFTIGSEGNTGQYADTFNSEAYKDPSTTANWDTQKSEVLLPVESTVNNVAALANGGWAVASSEVAGGNEAIQAIDQVSTEWWSECTAGTCPNEWIKVYFNDQKTIDQVTLTDTTEMGSAFSEGTLEFSDGTVVPFTGVEDNGLVALEVNFDPIDTIYVIVHAGAGVVGSNIGFKEITVREATYQSSAEASSLTVDTLDNDIVRATLTPNFEIVLSDGVDYADNGQGATATASTQSGGQEAINIVDGTFYTSWDSTESSGAWLQVAFGQQRTINRVELFDNEDPSVNFGDGYIQFDDQSTVPFTGLPNNGERLAVEFADKATGYIKVVSESGATGSNIGLRKVGAYQAVEQPTSVIYEMSVDGGGTWEPVTPEVEHYFSGTGSNLKWKATLTSTETEKTPKIYSVQIDYAAAGAGGSMTVEKSGVGMGTEAYALGENEALDPLTTYYWRVRSSDLSRASAWSDPWSFGVGDVSPPNSIIVYYTDGTNDEFTFRSPNWLEGTGSVQATLKGKCGSTTDGTTYVYYDSITPDNTKVLDHIEFNDATGGKVPMIAAVTVERA